VSISEKIKERIHHYDYLDKNGEIDINGSYYKATDNISGFIGEGELDLLVDEVAEKMQGVLDALVIDTSKDHNTQDTARRVAKMFVKEIFAGRYVEQPKITDFPNVTSYDQVYVVGPISIRSMCAHHFMPIRGKCYVGVFPGTRVIGLSKFNRLVDWLASRPQIQEELTSNIANKIKEVTSADGVAVLLKAEHMCCTHRGVKEHESDMTTSVMLGKFRGDNALKAEFLSIVGNMK
jgi:GTP cyclohydrolase I